MNKSATIYVAGHRGLVGSAMIRALTRSGYDNILTATHAELDLSNSAAVENFFAEKRPTHVFLAAAKVGGIVANRDFPADFIRENLRIQTNVITAAHNYGVEKLLFLGSSCIYPKLCPQPIKETYLLTGPLEETNRAYAIAKIAGIELCQAYHRQHGSRFISAMPTNLYGPNDNFHSEHSHVLPALIRRFHEAKTVGAPSVTLWGTGTPRREFLHVDDLGDACVLLMQDYDDPTIMNVGTGEDVTIRELAETIAEAVGYTGQLVWDPSKPDGTPRKLLDVSRIQALGWRHTIDLQRGVRETYAWYTKHYANLKNAT